MISENSISSELPDFRQTGYPDSSTDKWFFTPQHGETYTTGIPEGFIKAFRVDPRSITTCTETEDYDELNKLDGQEYKTAIVDILIMLAQVQDISESLMDKYHDQMAIQPSRETNTVTYEYSLDKIHKGLTYRQVSYFHPTRISLNPLKTGIKLDSPIGSITLVYSQSDYLNYQDVEVVTPITLTCKLLDEATKEVSGVVIRVDSRLENSSFIPESDLENIEGTVKYFGNSPVKSYIEAFDRVKGLLSKWGFIPDESISLV